MILVITLCFSAIFCSLSFMLGYCRGLDELSTIENWGIGFDEGWNAGLEAGYRAAKEKYDRILDIDSNEDISERRNDDADFESEHHEGAEQMERIQTESSGESEAGCAVGAGESRTCGHCDDCRCGGHRRSSEDLQNNWPDE